MLTKYEAAKKILELRKLPPKQLDNLEVLEGQILDLGLGFYGKCAENTNNLTLEQAIEKVRELTATVNFLATMHLVVGCDIHHFRAVSLAHFIEVPPEMQIDDIISRLTTRDCDVVHDDTPGHELFGKTTHQEKGKEEGKEKDSPHTPYKEKGQEESEKERVTNACAREEKKKLKEEKKRIEAEMRNADQVFQDFFAKLWEKYPRGRKNLKEKGAAKLWEFYNAENDKEAFIVKVLASLDEHINCAQWKRKVIPWSSTWIDQHRWTEAAPNDFCDTRKVSGVSQTANVKSNRAKGLW